MRDRREVAWREREEGKKEQKKEEQIGYVEQYASKNRDAASFWATMSVEATR